MAEDTAAHRRTIAERLTHLMSTGHPDGTGPRDYHAVEQASQDYAERYPGSPTISRQTVHNLRNERVANPGINSLTALANVYRVPISYFLSEGAGQGEAAAGRTPAPDPDMVLQRLDGILKVLQPDTAATLDDDARIAVLTARNCPIGRDALDGLRSGQWDERLRLPLGELAARISLPAGYFVDHRIPAADPNDLLLLGALKAQGARGIALRQVAGLPEDAFQALSPMLDLLSKADPRRRM
ncbi:hypothetical protein [Kitasatospora sp. NPDC093558]|uniref:hypothetical protein n=1 Tax=Kitasatospora sp. NPDC093558 TaxID=3155201 RepID=UPI003447F96B